MKITAGIHFRIISILLCLQILFISLHTMRFSSASKSATDNTIPAASHYSPLNSLLKMLAEQDEGKNPPYEKTNLLEVIDFDIFHDFSIAEVNHNILVLANLKYLHHDFSLVTRALEIFSPPPQA